MSDSPDTSASASASAPAPTPAPTTAFSLMFASNQASQTSSQAQAQAQAQQSQPLPHPHPHSEVHPPPHSDPHAHAHAHAHAHSQPHSPSHLPASTTDTETTDTETEEEGDAELDNLDQGIAQHPLETGWTFWYNAPQKQSSEEWQSNVKPVMDVTTVEEFWRLYNVLKAPSLLVNGSNYHMFRAGISPEWEDPVNRNGGKWVYTIPLSRSKPEEYAAIVDSTWMETLLAVIGETFDFSDEICGAVISPRPKETRVAVWTRTASDAHACMRIGHAFKAQIGTTASIAYLVHRDCMKRGTSFRNAARYTV